MTALTHIRSTAIAKANRLQSCHLHLDQLAPAFAEWAEGEIYVCKKTGTYRYRFGERSKSVAPWDATARAVFATPAEFAFAAMVLVEQAPEFPATKPVAAAAQVGRVNIVALAA